MKNNNKHIAASNKELQKLSATNCANSKINTSLDILSLGISILIINLIIILG